MRTSAPVSTNIAAMVIGAELEKDRHGIGRWHEAQHQGNTAAPAAAVTSKGYRSVTKPMKENDDERQGDIGLIAGKKPFQEPHLHVVAARD